MLWGKKAPLLDTYHMIRPSARASNCIVLYKTSVFMAYPK